MFSFFNKKNKYPVPEWASFFTEKEFNDFVKELNAYFQPKGISPDLEAGLVIVNDQEFGAEQLGLYNLAQICKQAPAKHYKEIVEGHFNGLKQANRFDQSFSQVENDFEAVKQYIGVRIYNVEYIDQLGKEFTIGKFIADDLYAILVYDLPDSVRNIKPEMSGRWNKSTEELFEFGIDNIRSAYPADLSKEKLGNLEVWFGQGDHFFVPNLIFDLDKYPDFTGTGGALVGIPHRHACIIYPIHHIETVTAINALIPLIHGMNSEGPGSLSDGLYWYKDQQLTRLPYQIDNGKIEFSPTEEFVQLIQELK